MVKKKTPRKKRAKTTTTERGRGRTRLSTASTAALHAEIERRLLQLEKKRKELSVELDALDEDIAACAGAVADARRGGNGSTRSGRRIRSAVDLGTYREHLRSYSRLPKTRTSHTCCFSTR